MLQDNSRGVETATPAVTLTAPPDHPAVQRFHRDVRAARVAYDGRAVALETAYGELLSALGRDPVDLIAVRRLARDIDVVDGFEELTDAAEELIRELGRNYAYPDAA